MGWKQAALPMARRRRKSTRYATCAVEGCSFRRIMHIALVLLALVLCPALVPAQVMPAQVIRRAGTDGMALSDGEPISFILEHAQMLDLVDGQRTSLIVIRRRLRATNEPYVQQLDSLREMLGLSLEPRPRGLTDEDRKRLQRFEQLSQRIADSIRINNDAALIQARAVLDSIQVRRLDSLIVEERGTIGGRRVPPAALLRPPSPRSLIRSWR